MEPRNTSTITCPQCGAGTPLPESGRLLRCAYCNATLWVDRSQVVSHYRVDVLLDREQAVSALRRWMAGNDTVKHLDRQAAVQDASLVWFPLWLFRTEAPDGEQVLVEPAAATPIPQLADLELPAGKLEPYRKPPDDGEVVPASVPLATARDWLAQRDAGEERSTALVHVPFWRCRYRFGDASFQAMVEASTGTVLAAVYPHKADSPYYVTAAVGALIFLFEGLAVSNPLWKMVVYAITAVPLTLAAWTVARRV
jgi:hypothetical protein